MDPIRLLVDGVLLPAGLALLVLGVAAAARRAGPAVGGVALALAFLGGAAKTGGVPPFPARDALGWLFWAAPVFALAGPWIQRLPSPRRWMAWLGPVLVVCGLLLRAPIQYQWSGPRAVASVGIAVLAALLLIEAHARVSAAPPRRVAVLQAIALGCSALSLGLTGSIKLAQLAGIVASGLGALAAVALLRPAHAPPPAGLAPLLTLLQGGLLLAGVLFSALPPLAALLLILAPATLGLEARRAWIGAGLCLGLSLAGLALAFLDSGVLDGPMPV